MTTTRKGRPKAKKLDLIDRHVSILLTEATYKKLAKVAARDGRTVSGQARFILDAATKGVR